MGADQPQLGRITTLLKPVFGDLFRDMMMVNAVESTTAKSLLAETVGDGVGPFGLRQAAVKSRVDPCSLWQFWCIKLRLGQSGEGRWVMQGCQLDEGLQFLFQVRRHQRWVCEVISPMHHTR